MAPVPPSPQPPVVLVTGSARRMGKAVALHLHRRGACVVLHSRSAAQEGQALADSLNAQRPGSALHVQADLATPEGCERLAALSAGWHQRLDGLVNNASVFARTAQGALDPAGWAEQMDTNARAVALLCQAAYPWLARSPAGAVVNITDARVDRPMPGFLAYSASKAALLSLTRSLALEWAPRVRVNAAAPGSLDWPKERIFDDAEQQTILNNIPLQRLGSGEDLAAVVAFLLFDAAYVTGQVLAVDGGSSLVSR